MQQEVTRKVLQPERLKVEFEQQAVELSVRTHGSGRSILFLHGLMHSSEIWRPIGELLSDEFQLVTVDLPGFGCSPPLPQKCVSPINYARIISSATNVLSERSEIAAVVADSLSAAIVAHASKFGIGSSRTRLLLSGCPLDGLPLLLRMLPISSLIVPTIDLLKAAPISLSGSIINLLARYTVHDWTCVGSEIVRGVLHADPATARRMYDALKEPMLPELAECLAQYQCVFLRGKFDRVISHASLSSWAHRVGARFVELPRSGHTPMIEEPDSYAQVIRDFVR